MPGKRKRGNYQRKVYKKRRYAPKEPTPFGDVGSKVGEKLGGFFGISKAGKIGGRMLGSGIGKLLFGSGDYNGNLEMIKVNSIVNPQETPDVLSTFEDVDAGDSVIIRRTEYIKDIVSSATANTFTTEEFVINPGQSGTFPFLSQIAKNYEEYDLRGCVFHFKSLSGDSVASVQSGLGYVAMATQYDVLDLPFTSKSLLENYSMSQSGKPSIDQIHGLECHPAKNVSTHLYVRPAGQPLNSDARLYDMAKTTIATSCPGTSVTLGELWVSYEVKLYKPKILGGVNAGATLQVSRSNVASTTMTFGSIGVQIIGSLASQCTASASEIQVTNLDPEARYLVTLGWRASVNLSSPNANFTITDGTAIDAWTGQTGTINQFDKRGQTTTVSQEVLYGQIIAPSSAGVITLTNVSHTIVSGTWGFDAFFVQLEPSNYA